MANTEQLESGMYVNDNLWKYRDSKYKPSKSFSIFSWFSILGMWKITIRFLSLKSDILTSESSNVLDNCHGNGERQWAMIIIKSEINSSQ